MAAEELAQEMEKKLYPKIFFDIPIAKQRYQRVAQILQKLISESVKTAEVSDEGTILDVGCGNLTLHQYLKKLSGVKDVIYLDKDEDLMKLCKGAVDPTITEIVEPRTTPLRARIYAGCIAKVDPVILKSNIFAVVGIEVVEHLEEGTLKGFEESVFGIVNPPLVIITTPNIEFNKVFNITSGFRHWDHKFEWTRAEFVDWCEKICKTYPGYTFETEGIGKWDPGEIEFGCVTQLAVFRLNSEIEVIPPRKANSVTENRGSFTLIADVEYPFDDSPLETKILKAFNYYIFNKSMMNDRRVLSRINSDNNYVDIPLKILLEIQLMPTRNISEETIKATLEKGGYELLQTEGSGEMCVRLELSSLVDNKPRVYESKDDWDWALP